MNVLSQFFPRSFTEQNLQVASVGSTGAQTIQTPAGSNTELIEQLRTNIDDSNSAQR